MTKPSKEDNVFLKRVSYTYHSVLFKKDKIRALINFKSKFNTISLDYVLKLGWKIYHTNVKAPKIDGSMLKMFEIVLTSFKIEDKFRKTCFF